MNIKITNKPVKITTEVYKLHIASIDTDNPHIHELTDMETLHDYIKITAKYIQLLDIDDSDISWCNVEADLIEQAAEMVNVELPEDAVYEIYPRHPDYECFARPSHYWVTYVDKSGVEYQCDVEQVL